MCIPNAECNDHCILIILALSAILYTLFLLFQNDFISLVFSASLSIDFIKLKQSKKEGHPDEAIDRKPSNGYVSEGNVQEPRGGCFLIMLFYYFQDAMLLYVSTPYVVSQQSWVLTLEQSIGEILKFRLNLFHLASTIRTYHLWNLCSRFSFYHIYFSSFFIIYVYAISKCCQYSKVYGYTVSGIQERSSVDNGNKKPISSQDDTPKQQTHTQHSIAFTLSIKESIAFMLAVILMLQKLSLTMFTLLQCVQVSGQSVLFIQGTVVCYQSWQIAVLVYSIISIITYDQSAEDSLWFWQLHSHWPSRGHTVSIRSYRKCTPSLDTTLWTSCWLYCYYNQINVCNHLLYCWVVE